MVQCSTRSFVHIGPRSYLHCMYVHSCAIGIIIVGVVISVVGHYYHALSVSLYRTACYNIIPINENPSAAVIFILVHQPQP